MGAAVTWAGALGWATRGHAREHGETAFLRRLVRVEQASAVAYETIAEADFADARIERMATLFAEQEREHVQALNAALRDLGGRPPRPPDPGEIAGLDELGSQDDALELMIGLEEDLVTLYNRAAARFAGDALLRLGMQIACNDAQHLTVLRQQLGRRPVPDALVPEPLDG